MAINDLEKMNNYNPTNYVNNSEPDIDADNLNKTENKLAETVEKANQIIDALKTLISTVQTNSETTVPSSSLAYAMQQEITKNKEDIATANSNLAENLGKLISFSSETSYTSSAEMMNYIQNTAPIGYSVLYNNANNTISTCYTYKASNNTLHVMRITTNGQSSLDAALHWCSGGAWNSKRITPT